MSLNLWWVECREGIPVRGKRLQLIAKCEIKP